MADAVVKTFTLMHLSSDAKTMGDTRKALEVAATIMLSKEKDSLSPLREGPKARR